MAAKKGARVVDTLREELAEPADDEAVEAEAAEEEARDQRARKPRVVDADVAALFPPSVAVAPETITAASKAWREATDREAPSIERLSAAGVIARIDVDALSGYVAVVTRDDTWRAFLPRELVATVVTLMLRRPYEELAETMAKGPGALAPRTPATVSAEAPET